MRANPVVRPNGFAPTVEPDENIRQPNVTNCTISCSIKCKQEENELYNKVSTCMIMIICINSESVLVYVDQILYLYAYIYVLALYCTV